MSESQVSPSKKIFSRRSLRELIATILIWISAVLVVGILAWILIDIFSRGLSQLSFSFLVGEPENAGRSGGIGSVILSTLMILVVALTAAVPLSLATAISLAETTGKQSSVKRLARRCLDFLAAVPSIVFGLFGNAFFCIVLGMGYSILSGGLTLACMILPILTRTTEQGIRAVPSHLLLAAASLGLSRTTTFCRIVLPAAAPALIAGLVLGIGRAIAETAALIFTSGYVSRTPESFFDSGRALSVHVYDMAMNVPGGNERAYAAAAVLILLLLVINSVAHLFVRVAARRSTSPTSAGNLT